MWLITKPDSAGNSVLKYFRVLSPNNYHLISGKVIEDGVSID
jgi:hypothetical protein